MSECKTTQDAEREMNLEASVRLSQIADLLPDIPAGTAMSYLEIKDAIKSYIQKLEKVVKTEPERLCRCCQKPESTWIQNDDLAHFYIGENICQACESIISWACDSPGRLETIAAYLRLLRIQEAE